MCECVSVHTHTQTHTYTIKSISYFFLLGLWPPFMPSVIQSDSTHSLLVNWQGVPQLCGRSLNILRRRMSSKAGRAENGRIFFLSKKTKRPKHQWGQLRGTGKWQWDSCVGVYLSGFITKPEVSVSYASFSTKVSHQSQFRSWSSVIHSCFV